MNVFEKVIELETSTEAELGRLYKERDEIRKNIEKSLKSPMVEHFKKVVVGENGKEGDIPSEQLYQQYMDFLTDMIDNMKALKIYDQTIILLETGYDPSGDMALETDMDFQ